MGIYVCLFVFFSLSILGLNSGPHACYADALPLGPFHQSTPRCLKGVLFRTMVTVVLTTYMDGIYTILSPLTHK
jgi:hypothetical protein